ncbi:MAG TPA: hypothetical protein PKD42_16985 [Chitinophagaceae bacterium]|nr:hypothetical protein [Chitinophagaceae bacterium]
MVRASFTASSPTPEASKALITLVASCFKPSKAILRLLTALLKLVCSTVRLESAVLAAVCFEISDARDKGTDVGL